MENKISESDLIETAKAAAFHAKAGLSHYRVGAAILAAGGKVYSGCNIEFDNYSNTIHAEESAISAFVTAGEKEMKAIAVFTFGEKPAWPCGMCLQSLFELGGPELTVVAGCPNGAETKTVNELLPFGFKLS